MKVHEALGEILSTPIEIGYLTSTLGDILSHKQADVISGILKDVAEEAYEQGKLDAG